MEESCVFCKIIKGEIPSVTIYEDEEFKVIFDAFPGTKGHALIIPKNHVKNMFEMDEMQAGRLFMLANKVAKAMNQHLDLKGLNIVQNNGDIAGQTVFHFHLHLIPRYEKDDIKIKWSALKFEDELLKELGSKIGQDLKE